MKRGLTVRVDEVDFDSGLRHEKLYNTLATKVAGPVQDCAIFIINFIQVILESWVEVKYGLQRIALGGRVEQIQSRLGDCENVTAQLFEKLDHTHIPSKTGVMKRCVTFKVGIINQILYNLLDRLVIDPAEVSFVVGLGDLLDVIDHNLHILYFVRKGYLVED